MGGRRPAEAVSVDSRRQSPDSPGRHHEVAVLLPSHGAQPSSGGGPETAVQRPSLGFDAKGLQRCRSMIKGSPTNRGPYEDKRCAPKLMNFRQRSVSLTHCALPDRCSRQSTDIRWFGGSAHKAQDAMSAPYAPLLRVFWPRQLLLPVDQADRAPVELVGWRSGTPALQEIVVTGTLPSSAVPPPGDACVVGALLQQPVDDGASASLTYRSPCFVLVQTTEPGSLLPVLLPAPAAAAATPGPATRRRRQQAHQQQQTQHQQYQVVLYDSVSPLRLEDGAGWGLQRGTAGRRHNGTSRQQLAASLASHLAGALLAALLLAHWHGVTATAAACGSQLASFVSRQLAWFASSQPAGRCPHPRAGQKWVHGVSTEVCSAAGTVGTLHVPVQLLVVWTQSRSV